MGAPGIGQLPAVIVLVPNFHAMVRRRREDAIAVEIELCHRNNVLMTRFEFCAAGHSERYSDSARGLDMTFLSEGSEEK